MMLFTFYFFKEQNRDYDLADLLAFFQANPYVTIEKETDTRRMHYRNDVLDFDADFVVTPKSVVPNIEKLNPKFYDINLRCEFPILLANYKVQIIIDLIESICKRFNFFVYNEFFEDVSPFRKGMLKKIFELAKQAYKRTYEDEIAEYNKLDVDTLNSVYSYIEQRLNYRSIYRDEKIIPLDYSFYKQIGARRAYVAAKWDGITPFIMPPKVEILVIYENRTTRMISYKEFEKKISKFLKPVSNSSIDINYVTYKDIKKIHKLVTKGKFSPLSVQLDEIKLNKILDV